MQGILFHESLFPSVISKGKTQTRRISNHQGVYLCPGNPKYKKGEVLFLKEPWLETEFVTVYKYGYPDSLPAHWLDDVGFPIPNVNELRFNNKLFMGKKSARYFIQITDVRVEKLQDISDEDCIKEGIDAFTKDDTVWKFGLNSWEWGNMPRSPREAFAYLIDNINKRSKGTWDNNPYVWVYDFVLIDSPNNI